MANEKHMRSVMKGVSWRVLATLTTMVLVFIFTGDLMIMVEVGVFEVVLKLIIYYVHERAWNAVPWGVDQK